MKMLTLDEFERINHTAHSLALEIIGECGDPDDAGDSPGTEEFVVWQHANGVYVLEWRDYGPFNPVPQWAWDPQSASWVDPEESDEAFELFESLTDG